MELADLKSQLAELDTASLCDADPSVRVMDPSLRPLRPGLVLLGIARTVRAAEDFLTVLKALKEASPGEVLVIDTQGGRRAVAGEMFSTEAHRRGLAGIVIDGACRDTRRIRELPMPVYARCSNPLAGSSQQLFETQVEVRCGGVDVRPGDIVFGDEDGIVVLDPSDLPRLLPLAREVQRREQAALEWMSRGESLFDLLNYDEHEAAVRGRRDSRLKFR